MKEIKPGMIIQTHEGLWVCFPRQKEKIGFINYHKSCQWKSNIPIEEIINIFSASEDCKLCGKLLYSIKWKKESIVERNNEEFIYILYMTSATECGGIIIDTITGTTKLGNNISLVGTILSSKNYLNSKLIKLNKKWDGCKIINLFKRNDIKPGMTIEDASLEKFKVVDDNGQLRLLSDKNQLISGDIKDHWDNNLQPLNYSIPIKEITDENNKILYHA